MSEILRWQTRKTRKSHQCFGCGKVYPPDSTIVSSAYADGGTVFSAYWCETCQEYMHQHFRYGDETGEGEIFANDPEGWNEIKKGLEEAP